MKLNVSNPSTGSQKTFEVMDDHKLRHFYDRRMGAEVTADHLGDEWAGYILKIAGGNDKQGFPMKQGVLTNTRVRLLLKKGHSCYRPRRTGERKRKSVRGCIVDQNLSALALIVVRKGQKEIPGLTDVHVPRRLGPKRASNIRKLYKLSKHDDVRQYVVKRPLPEKDGKKAKLKAPKIQRLITPNVLQRKRHRLAIKKRRIESRKESEAEYAKLLAVRRRQERTRRRSRMSSMRDSRSSISSDKGKKEKEVLVLKEKKVKKVKKVVKKVEAKTEAKDKKDVKEKKVKKVVKGKDDAKKTGEKKVEKKADKKVEKKVVKKDAAAPKEKKEAPKRKPAPAKTGEASAATKEKKQKKK